MSFTQTVKEELISREYESGCCQYAELAGIIAFSGVVRKEQGDYSIRITTESSGLARKVFKLSKQLFGAAARIEIRRHAHEKAIHSYVVIINNAAALLGGLEMLERGAVNFRISNDIVGEECCAGAFIRGAFLGGGSIADPERRYHMEFVTSHFSLSKDFRALFERFGINARTVVRKSNYVTYFKESEAICDCLAAAGAHNAVLNIYNIKILKEIKNQANRVTNFESANIHKTVDASIKQVEAIRKIERTTGIDKLPKGLQRLARLRLEYTDISLSELGQMLDPPIGKSGVNHRIRRIMQIAKEL